MTPILLCLVFGLAFVIERIFYLNLASVNSQKLLNKIEDAIQTDGIDKAKQICRDTKGPLGGIFYQGLDRADEGLESVEKAVVAYGGVQMGKLESNLSWIGLCISLAPMLGFLGTVVGMVIAFHNMEANPNNLNIKDLSSGIYIAMVTTVAGLIVGIIAFFFYNIIVARISQVVHMLEAKSTEFIDLLHEPI